MTRTLLLDADSAVYSLAHAHQMPMPWTPELWTYKGDLAGAKHAFQEFVDRTMEATNCVAMFVALSDTRANFRKRVRGTYKFHRAGKERPVLFKAIRDWLREEYGAVVIPSLEGDDLVSMWATAPHMETSVVCSIDKDCRSIPGSLYNPKSGRLEVISEAEAERFFYSQVLTGDRTDGYEGCPGVGPKRAEALLKGVHLPDVWAGVVVPAYRAAGLSEAVALENARCARLLRSGDYQAGEPNLIRLWHPYAEPAGEREWMAIENL